MKRQLQRVLLLGALIAFAVAWVFLMSLGTVRPGSAVGPDGTAGTLTRIDADSAFPAITTNMLLRDAAGEPLKGLSREAFELTEDGIPVDLSDFVGAGGQPVTAILVIDRSSSMDSAGKMAGAREAAKTFISMMREGQDNLGIILFSSGVTTLAPVQPVTAASKSALIAEIDRVRPEGGTLFHDAIYQAIGEIAGAEGRTVVIALTDGQDTGSRNRGGDVVDFANENDLPLYTIGLGSGSDVNADHLERLATQTGGEFHQTPSASELAALYAKIAAELQNEYVLSYSSPTPQLDGTQRQVVVKVRYAAGELQASDGYAVGGIIKSSFNYPFFGALLALLLALLAAPSVARRLMKRRQSMKVQSPPPPIAPPIPQPPVPAPATMRAAPASPSIAPAPRQAPAAPAPAAHARLVMRVPVGDRATLGSAPHSTVPLRAPGIVAHHATIALENGRYTITDHSGGRTAVSYSGNPSQLRPSSKNALQDGSLIRIGDITLRYRQPAPGTPWLEAAYPLAAQGTRIGSAPDAQVTLAHPSIAPHHAEFSQQAGRWIVRDLNSPHGTFVSYSGTPDQERRVSGTNALKNGSTVRLGEVRFVFQID